MGGLRRASGIVALVVLTCGVVHGDLYWGLELDGGGVPLVLHATGGHQSPTVGELGATYDGYVYAFDGAGSGWEYHILDPADAEPNNAVSGKAQTALVRCWDANREMYEASVSTGVKVGFPYSDGITRTTPTGSFFQWSGGGTAETREIRFEDGTGAYDATASMGARRALDSTNGGSGSYHKAGLALIGESGSGTDVWNLVGGLSSVGAGLGAPINNSVRKMQWGALTGLDLVTPAPGTRAVTGFGRLVDGGGSATGLLSSLVPFIADEAYEMAFNPDDGNLYFVSNDTTNSRVFVSAVSLPANAFDAAELGNDSVVTYVDLDPNSANTYLEVTYDGSGEPGTPGQDLFVSGGITFAPDGSRMYLSNSIGASAAPENRVFVFTRVPEPATMGLVLLGSTALALLRKRKR